MNKTMRELTRENVLFITEKEWNTANDILCRILTYLEQYVKKNGFIPDFVKLTKQDLSKIKEYNPNVINEENKILGMEIKEYKEKKYEFKRNGK